MTGYPSCGTGKRTRLHPGRKHRAPGCRSSKAAAPSVQGIPVADKFIAQVLSVQPTTDSEAASTALDRLKASQMPSTKVESYRFTDLKPLLSQTLVAQPQAETAAIVAAVKDVSLADTEACTAVVVDGVYRPDLSDLGSLPDGVFVGELSGAPEAVQQKLGSQAAERGGVFVQMNSVTSRSPLVVHSTEGVVCQVPIHIVYVSSGAAETGSAVVSSARALVHAEASSQIEVVQEFVAIQHGGGRYFVNAVLEVSVAADAYVQHRLVETDDAGAFSVHSTLVQQEEGSSYHLVEARLGGSLTRHDVDIDQLGPRTTTKMKHFLLCSEDQLHDLHTSLKLHNPEGVADQLHKCIVSHASGRGVFDGNVQVSKLAQQTDARQMSRNLLLVPKATVNVKPNLQIIADDVKCTHGCAVSDLSTDEMFYFLSRGIDSAEARKALVFSFGAEVVQQLSHKALVERVQAVVGAKLGEKSL